MSFTAGAGTRFVVTSASSQSSGTVLTGPITATAGTATTNTPAFDITQTWNNAGVTFTGFRFNITDTASAAGSLLMDLQRNGVTQFAVQKDAGGYVIDGAYGLRRATNVATVITGGLTGGGASIDLNGTFVTLNRLVLDRSNQDVILARDAANTLAQRNATNAQTFRIYNTFTDASNYERLSVDWTSNVAYIRPQNAGTGSARIFVPVTGATTVAALPAAATAGAGARAFVTDANATTFASTVAGGGANAVPVVSNGTNWIIG